MTTFKFGQLIDPNEIYINYDPINDCSDWDLEILNKDIVVRVDGKTRSVKQINVNQKTISLIINKL